MLSIALLATSCGSEPEEDARPVSETEAKVALGELTSIAAKRTTHSMEELCDLSLDDCSGMSGAVLYGPESAPGDDAEPTILCSLDVGSGAWMLVVEGQDGFGRSYASQVVFGRDGDRVVTLREPAFWLGVGYAGPKVVGSTSWSTAYHPSGATAPAHTQKVLGRARSACDRSRA
jgi:hypothetical protein